MNEADQIHHILSDVAWWEDDQCRNWSMQGGVSVDIGTKGPNWTWAIIRSDGKKQFGPQAFPTVRQAKASLRVELERMQSEIRDKETGPAQVSW